MKKIISLLCLFAFLPAVAYAADSTDSGDNVEDPVTPPAVTADNVMPESGDGILPNGYTMTGDLLVDTLPTDINAANYYIEMADNTSRTIRTGGDITGNGQLYVAATRNLTIDRNPDESGPAYNIKFATMTLDGILNAKNVGDFKSNGTVTVNGGLNVDAQTIYLGATTVGNGATLNLVSTGETTARADAYDMYITGLTTVGNSSTVNLAGKSIMMAGNIENPTGTMNIDVATGMDVMGLVSNGGTMTFTGGGSLNVTQTITNTGTMVLGNGTSGLKSLTADKIILQGNSSFSAVISGATNIVNGFDLSGMGTGGRFNLETGTLTAGFSGDLDNKLSSFTLAVANGELALGNIINGGLNNDNVDAEMRLAAEKITVDSITNNGSALNITKYTPSTGGTTYLVNDITVSGDIRNNSGDMTLDADDTFTAGNVSNAGGNMILNGQNSLNIAGISISGGTALIASSSDADGLANPNGGITIGNNGISNTGGALTIAARELTVGGNITHGSTAGTTHVRINNTMNVDGNIYIAGGKLTVDVLGTGTGIVTVGGTFDVGETGQIDLDSSVNSVVVDKSVTVDGNLLGGTSTADGSGNLNVANNTSQGFELTSTNGNIEIGNDIRLTTDVSSGARSITLAAANMNVGGDVYVSGSGATLTFGSDTAQVLNVTGTAGVANGAKMVIKAGTARVGALTDMMADAAGDVAGSAGSIDAYGNQISSGAGGIKLAGGIRFDGNADATGLNILASGNQFALTTANTVADIDIAGGMSVADTKTLNVTSSRDLTIGGAIEMLGTFVANVANNATFGNKITNTGSFNVTANNGNIETKDIVNSSTMNLTSTKGDITTGAILHTNGTAAFNAGGKITSTKIDAVGGKISMMAQSVDVDSITVAQNGSVVVTATDTNNGTISVTGALDVSSTTPSINTVTQLSAERINIGTNLTMSNSVLDLIAGDISVGDAISVTGNIAQGNVTMVDTLTFGSRDVNVSANTLNLSGKFDVLNNSGTYKFTGDATIGGALTVASGASANMTANTIAIAGAVGNNGTLSLVASGALNSADVALTMGELNNNGDLTLDTGIGIANVDNFTNTSTGTVKLTGSGMSSNGGFVTTGTLYQDADVSPNAGDVAILSDNYKISALGTGNAGTFAVADIVQKFGKLTINASTVNIAGNIAGSDITFVATNPVEDNANWLVANIGGSVSGGTSFIGLESLTVGKNYIFNDDSRINALIKKREDSNYWATITMEEGEDFGKITNQSGASALINVGGQFISTQGMHPDSMDGGVLTDASVGIVLQDMVDQGTAIWLVHAEGDGIASDDSPLKELGDKLRNLNVMFCNADGTKCFSYYNYDKIYNGSGTDLPAYLSVRDTDGDGKNDSLYVVFDPEFGGPVQVFQIQPIVDKTQPHTDNEYVSAGALDDLIMGKLHETGFYNRTPIEAIPVIFAGTNMEQLANELYARMERYLVDRDGAGLARFSRLVTPREVENLMGSIALNEHTNFRGLEDHMLNEFIWNRNRRLKNAWVDVDFGIFNQDVSDGTTVDGNRFSISGGFDWQHDRTTIFGLTARVSYMSMDNNDSFDLGYIPNQPIDGHVDVTVDDMNVGVGGYMIKTLNPKMRLYGNLFADIHMLSVSRDMNYMSKIDGDGNTFAVTTEWGLMHDWLNQYVVGNLYVRAGYNTGFSITERADGADYMKLESDGYVNVAPGYTLTMQKRIYPSPWVQIRPHISAGVEYDVLGMPDTAKYKFASAERFTDYDVEINPLWANFGGGVDVLSVRGFQVGLDYRYQYNTDIRMHNIKVSGSYRF